MPLCTLEIPRTQFESLPLDRNQIVINACEKALDQTLKGLDIPDPDDREYRVIITNNDHGRISLAFTQGGDEYDTGTIFDPSKKQIHTTGLKIKAGMQGTLFDSYQVEMESWR